ncbi:hypothetical protein BH10BAC5_BH10BAC5_20080 [soil metagenome]
MLHPKIELKHLLLPSIPEITRNIVESSCTKLLYNLNNLISYILTLSNLKENDKIKITATLENIKQLDNENLFKFLSSPIFRGWYYKFGLVREYTCNDKFFNKQIKFWNNFTNSFYYNEKIDCSFEVINEVCFSWDSLILIKTKKNSSLYIKKCDEVIEIKNDENKKILLSFKINKSDDSYSIITQTDKEVELVLPKLYLKNSKIAVRNDIPTLKLKLSGNLDRENAISNELDFSKENYGTQFSESDFLTASKLIEEYWNPEYLDFKETLQIVIPREVPFGWRARGMTVSAYQGAIWIMAKGLLPVFENLIHEQGHVKLRYIEEFCPILEEGQSEKRFNVAWRSDPRPLIGIYEGVYVHMHMLMGLTILFENKIAEIPQDVLFERVEHLRNEVSAGLEILCKNALFTTQGTYFVEWAKSMLDEVPI